jgi:multimeric flavodoxin WrbA
MKITVLGGSPKGQISVTMQYVKFLQTNYPEHEFRVLQPAQTIVRLERDPAAFADFLENIRSADLVLWAFPLYVFSVCAQYLRFIELLGERGQEAVFAGKYAASLSTSIHFFDHTAHRFIREVCDSLAMPFIGSFSAHMNDLLEKPKQRQLLVFFDDLVAAVAEKREIPPVYSALPPLPAIYKPGPASREKISTAKRVTVIADTLAGNTGAMARRFMSAFAGEPELVDLSALNMKGGCHGCLKCGAKNVCAYTGKDDFIPMFEEAVKKADLIVFCVTLKGRALSSRFKLFLDRGFYNTHQRSLSGKQVAFLVSGNLSRAENQREIMTGYVEWQNANLAEIASDEHTRSLDGVIDSLARRLVRFADLQYSKPLTFLGYAGMKVFRDDVFGELRVVFKGDHRAYKKTGAYDFPQNKYLGRLMIGALYWITSIPWISNKLFADFRKIMIMPYRNVVQKKIRLV